MQCLLRNTPEVKKIMHDSGESFDEIQRPIYAYQKLNGPDSFPDSKWVIDYLASYVFRKQVSDQIDAKFAKMNNAEDGVWSAYSTNYYRKEAYESRNELNGLMQKMAQIKEGLHERAFDGIINGIVENMNKQDAARMRGFLEKVPLTVLQHVFFSFGFNNEMYSKISELLIYFEDLDDNSSPLSTLDYLKKVKLISDEEYSKEVIAIDNAKAQGTTYTMPKFITAALDNVRMLRYYNTTIGEVHLDVLEDYAKRPYIVFHEIGHHVDILARSLDTEEGRELTEMGEWFTKFTEQALYGKIEVSEELREAVNQYYHKNILSRRESIDNPIEIIGDLYGASFNHDLQDENLEYKVLRDLIFKHGSEISRHYMSQNLEVKANTNFIERFISKVNELIARYVPKFSKQAQEYPMFGDLLFRAIVALANKPESFKQKFRYSLSSNHINSAAIPLMRSYHTDKLKGLDLALALMNKTDDEVRSDYTAYLVQNGFDKQTIEMMINLIPSEALRHVVFKATSDFNMSVEDMDFPPGTPEEIVKFFGKHMVFIGIDTSNKYNANEKAFAIGHEFGHILGVMAESLRYGEPDSVREANHVTAVFMKTVAAAYNDVNDPLHEFAVHYYEHHKNKVGNHSEVFSDIFGVLNKLNKNVKFGESDIDYGLYRLVDALSTKLAKEVKATNLWEWFQRAFSQLMRWLGISDSVKYDTDLLHNIFTKILSDYNSLKAIRAPLRVMSANLSGDQVMTVDETRSIIDALDKEGTFYSDSHTYISNNNELYNSVTTLLHGEKVGYPDQKDRPEFKRLEPRVDNDIHTLAGTSAHAQFAKELVKTLTGDSSFNPQDPATLETTSKFGKELTTLVNDYVKRPEYKLLGAETKVFTNTGKRVAGSLDLLVRLANGENAIIDLKTKIGTVIIENADGTTETVTKSGWSSYKAAYGYKKSGLSYYATQGYAYKKLLESRGVPIGRVGILPAYTTVRVKFQADGSYTAKLDGIEIVDLEKYVRGQRNQYMGDIITPGVLLLQESTDVREDVNSIFSTDVGDTTLKNINKLNSDLQKLLTVLASAAGALSTRGNATLVMQIMSSIRSITKSAGSVDKLDSEEILKAINLITNVLNMLQTQIGSIKLSNLGISKRAESLRTANITLSGLEMIREFASTLSTISSIKSESHGISKSVLLNLNSKLQDAVEQYDKLNTKLSETIKATLIEWLAPLTTRFKAMAELKARREYRTMRLTQDPNVQTKLQDKAFKKQFDIDERAYIDKYLVDNAEAIEFETNKYISTVLDYAEDTSAAAAATQAIQDSSDTILSIIAKSYDEVLHLRDDKRLEVTNQLQKLSNALYKKLGVSSTEDPRKVFDFMLEDYEVVDDSGTKHTYTRIVEDALYKTKREFLEYKQSLNIRTLGRTRYAELIREYTNKHMTISFPDNAQESLLERYESLLETGEISTETFELLKTKTINELNPRALFSYSLITAMESDAMIPLYEAFYNEHVQPLDKASDKYEALMKLDASDPLRQFYEYVVDLIADTESRFPKNRKIGFNLPGISVTNREAIIEGKWKEFGENIKGKIGLGDRNSDYQQMKNSLYKSETGTQLKLVPINYTNKIESEHQNYDIPLIINMWFNGANNYNAVSTVLPLYELTGNALKDRTMVRENVLNRGLRGLGLVQDKKTAIKSGSNNAYKQFEGFMNGIIYNNREFEIDKRILWIVRKVNRFTTSLGMAGNITMWMSNILTANVQRLIGVAGEKEAARYAKAWMDATAVWLANAPDRITEYKSSTHDNTLEVIARHLNMLNIGEEEVASVRDKWQRELTKFIPFNIFHSGMTVAEDSMTMPLMIARLMMYDVTDSDGKVVDNLYNILTVKDGKIGIKPEYYKTGHKVLVGSNTYSAESFLYHNGELRSIVSRKLDYEKRKLDGNTKHSTAAGWQSHALFASLMKFRSWIPSTVENFWGQLNAPQEGLYSEYTESFKKGIISTAYKRLSKQAELKMLHFKKYLGKVIDEEYTAKLALSLNPLLLTEQEKYKLQQFYAAVAIATALCAAAILTKNLYEDDKEARRKRKQKGSNSWLAWLSYITKRTQTELMFYVSVSDAIKILKSPIPAAGSLGQLTNLVGTLLWVPDWDAEDSKGNNKLWKQTQKTVPVLNQIRRFRNMDDRVRSIYSPPVY